MSYNHPIPDAPIALSMLPDVSDLSEDDYIYIVQKNQRLGRRCRKMTIGAFLATHFFDPDGKIFVDSIDTHLGYIIDKLAKYGGSPDAYHDGDVQFLPDDSRVGEHSVIKALLAPGRDVMTSYSPAAGNTVDVSSAAGKVILIDVSTTSSDPTTLSITGVKANTNIKAIEILTNMSHSEYTVTIDSTHTVVIPPGNSAIIAVTRYQDSLQLRTNLVTPRNAMGIFSGLQLESENVKKGLGFDTNKNLCAYTYGSGGSQNLTSFIASYMVTPGAILVKDADFNLNNYDGHAVEGAVIYVVNTSANPIYVTSWSGAITVPVQRAAAFVNAKISGELKWVQVS